jgi:hypothetical protein
MICFRFNHVQWTLGGKGQHQIDLVPSDRILSFGILASVEGFAGANAAEAGRYWSSSQQLDNAPWIQRFVEGVDAGAQDYEYKNYADSVRLMRAF